MHASCSRTKSVQPFTESEILQQYRQCSTLAGPLTLPTVAEEEVRYRIVGSERERRLILCMITLYIIASAAFLLWLVSPVHLPIHQPRLGSLGVVIGIIGFFLIILLELVRIGQGVTLCLFASRMYDPIPLTPQENLRVAVLTTIVPSKEPIELVARTLRAMQKITYGGSIDIWILDEGNDPEVKRVASELGVRHFSRKDRPEYNQQSGAFRARTKSGNHNAWRAEHEDEYDIVAQMDPDHVPFPEFLERTLGYFRDPDVAFVVAPQVYGNLEDTFVARGAADQSYMFHGVVQRSGNALGAPLLIGTNHLYRVKALQTIGGYQDSIIEDHLTSLRLHSTVNTETGRRWKGIYTPDILSIGEGPANWSDYFNQQQRWAYGIWEVILKHSPVLFSQLSSRQRLAYASLQLFYPSVGLIWGIGNILTALYLFLGITVIRLDLGEWLLFWPPTVLIQLVLFFWLRRFNLGKHERQMNGALHGLALSVAAGPIYVAAGLRALLEKPLSYIVTAKSRLATRDSHHTFRLHAVWLIGLITGLGVSVLVDHGHWPLRLWALNTLLATLFPVADATLRDERVAKLWSWPSIPSRKFASVTVSAISIALLVSTSVAIVALYPDHETAYDSETVYDSRKPETQQTARPVNQSEEKVLERTGTDLADSDDVPAARPEIPARYPIVTIPEERSLVLPSTESGRVMFGMFDESPASTPGDVRHVYYQWSRSPGAFAGFVEFAASQGQIAMISWEPRWGEIHAEADPTDVALLGQIAIGEHDGYIRSVARALAGARQPVIIRFAFEMDLGITALHPWSGQDPSTFLAAHRHVVDLFREEGADNVHWLWSPSAMTNAEGELIALEYYPGDAYVDYTGFSAFLYWKWEEWSPERAERHAYRSPKRYLTKPIQQLSELGHAIIIPEFGVDLHPSLPASAKEDWLRQAAAEIVAGEYPNLAAVVYFNTRHNWDDRSADWKLTPTEADAFFGTIAAGYTRELGPR